MVDPNVRHHSYALRRKGTTHSRLSDPIPPSCRVCTAIDIQHLFRIDVGEAHVRALRSYGGPTRFSSTRCLPGLYRPNTVSSEIAQDPSATAENRGGTRRPESLGGAPLRPRQHLTQNERAPVGGVWVRARLETTQAPIVRMDDRRSIAELTN